MSKQGHPLPGSDEARHNEIPEHLEREKGLGDDDSPVVRPEREAVNPDGEPYPYADLGRGPGAASAATEQAGDQARDNIASDEFAADLAEHQDRGQSAAEARSDAAGPG